MTNEIDEEKAFKSRPCLSLYVPFAAIIASIGGILFGYDIGIVSGALLQLKEVFSLTSFEQELVVCGVLIGAFCASFFGGIIVDQWGRKAGIVVSCVFFIAGSLVLVFSVNLIMLIIGRIIVGFAVSLSVTAECTYISEISPPSRRGMMVSFNEVGITIGFLIAYFVSYLFVSTDDGWKYMFGAATIPAVLQILGVTLMPSSHHYLLIKGKTDKARKVLRTLRKNRDTEEEIESIITSISEQKTRNYGDLFSSISNMRGRMLLGMILVFLQQFSGNANVLYYAPTVFQHFGYDSATSSTLVSVGLGIVKVIATIITLLIVDRVGRRSLLLVGSLLMATSIIILGVVGTVNNSQSASAQKIAPLHHLIVNYKNVSIKPNTLTESKAKLFSADTESNQKFTSDINMTDVTNYNSNNDTLAEQLSTGNVNVMDVTDYDSNNDTLAEQLSTGNVNMMDITDYNSNNDTLAEQLTTGNVNMMDVTDYNSNNDTLDEQLSTGNVNMMNVTDYDSNNGTLTESTSNTLLNSITIQPMEYFLSNNTTTTQSNAYSSINDSVTTESDAYSNTNDTMDSKNTTSCQNQLDFVEILSNLSGNLAATIYSTNDSSADYKTLIDDDSFSNFLDCNKTGEDVNVSGDLNKPVPFSLKVISAVSLMTFVCAYSISYGPVTWLILSEIFPGSLRGRAVSVATCVNWGSNIIVSLTFLDILNAIGIGPTFVTYGFISYGAAIFIFFCVPETKNKSLEEINQELSKGMIRKDWKDSVICQKRSYSMRSSSFSMQMKEIAPVQENKIENGIDPHSNR